MVFTDAEEEENTENQSQERTPTEENHSNPLTDPSLQPMRTSTERVADWKLNCTLIESTINPVNEDESEIYKTWF